MTLHLKIEEDPGFLTLYFEGSLESSDIPLVIDHVLQAAEDHKPSKILVDFLNLAGTLSTMDRFNLATQFAMKYLKGRMTGKFPNTKFAILGKPPLIESKRFGETVAINRGVNVKVFIDKTEALVWLGDEPSEDSKAQS